MYTDTKIHEIWDSMKDLNLRKKEIEKEEETLVNNTENIFNEIIRENPPNQKKVMPIKIQ